MPKISALIHTHNNARLLARTLDSLAPCDEVLVIDTDSGDETEKVAQDHHVTLKKAIPGVEPGAYAIDTRHEWVLCLKPGESLSDELQAALKQWKDTEPDEHIPGFKVNVRTDSRTPSHDEMRLVNRTRVNWPGELPPNADRAGQLNGDLLKS